MIIRIIRVLALGLSVFAYLVSAFAIHFTTTNPQKRRKKFVKNVRRYSAIALKIFGMNVKFINRPPKSKHFLIVSNHLGFFDIFFMAAGTPTLFVTSVEMRETPVLGLLTEMGGCLYVERRSRENIQNEIKEIENALNEGFNVVVYPEGTSGDGSKVLPFKKSLLTACNNSEANIMPVVLNYRKINGETVQDKFRDWICWYGEASFASSLWKASQISSAEIELEFLEEVHVSKETDRRDVAARAEQQIRERFNPIVRI